MIYFIECQTPGHPDNRPVKIGYTRRIDGAKARMRDMQTGCPFTLELIGVIPKGTVDQERELHAFFAGDHLRGEWFRPSPSLKRVMAKATRLVNLEQHRTHTTSTIAI